MNSEIECLKKNNTWVVVNKPQNKMIIDVKWVYKRKSDDSLKARLVVRGFQQRECQENVYSPVGKIKTEKNIADIFTKSLCKDKFIKNRNALKLI